MNQSKKKKWGKSREKDATKNIACFVYEYDRHVPAFSIRMERVHSLLHQYNRLQCLSRFIYPAKTHNEVDGKMNFGGIIIYIFSFPLFFNVWLVLTLRAWILVPLLTRHHI